MQNAAHIEKQISDALTATEGKSKDEQVRAVRAAVLAQPSRHVADDIWRWGVGGLVLSLVLLVLGLIVLIGIGRYNSAILTITTGVLSGLVGLFIQTPTRNGDG